MGAYLVLCEKYAHAQTDPETRGQLGDRCRVRIGADRRKRTECGSKIVAYNPATGLPVSANGKSARTRMPASPKTRGQLQVRGAKKRPHGVAIGTGRLARREKERLERQAAAAGRRRAKDRERKRRTREGGE